MTLAALKNRIRAHLIAPMPSNKELLRHLGKTRGRQHLFPCRDCIVDLSAEPHITYEYIPS